MQSQRSPIWEDMRPPALRRLAFGVALIFGVFGPIQILMLPLVPTGVWFRLLAITLTSGGFAGCIILFGRRLLLLLVTIAVFTALILAIPAFNNALWGEQQPPGVQTAEGTTVLSRADLEQQNQTRLAIGMIGVAMIAAGYAVFVYVITKEVQRRASLESEIKMAQGIQQALLPVAPVELPWCEIAGICVPATEVGGDYFDIVTLSEDEVLVVIGDVAGHGLGAGILAAMTKSALYAQLEQNLAAGQILAQLNQTLCRLTSKNSFVTFACAQLHRHTGKVRFATAGHPPILHQQAAVQHCTLWRTPGLALGLRREAAFEEREVALASGDVLLLYTDGVIEASNRAAEQFGEERLCRVVEKQKHASASGLSRIVIQAAKDFSASENFLDDATVVCVRMR